MFFWVAKNTRLDTFYVSTKPCHSTSIIGSHPTIYQQLSDIDFSIPVDFNDEITFYFVKFIEDKEIHYITKHLFKSFTDNIVTDEFVVKKTINFKMIDKVNNFKTNNMYNLERFNYNNSIGFIDTTIAEHKMNFQIIHDKRGKPYYYITHPMIEM